MKRSCDSGMSVRLLACVFALSILALLLTACGTKSAGTAGMKVPDSGSAQPEHAPVDATPVSDTTTDGAGAQTCATCAGKGMAPMIEGTAVAEGGAQVLKVGIVNGYYSPNQFKVKSGMPIKVVFAGDAKGCLAQPQFKSLGKKGDLSKGGTATIDLGVLPVGTYPFSCGMDMTGGKLVVE